MSTSSTTLSSAAATLQAEPSPRRRSATAVVVAAVFAVGRVVTMGPHLVDDAYISFRYAENLAGGHGLVFNPGQRVEGYSNFLWTLLLAAASAVGLDLPRTAVVLGGLALVGAVVVTVATALKIGLDPLSAGLIGCVVALLPATAGSSLIGLEEPLFMFGISLALYALVASNRRATIYAVAAMAIIGLTRPEGLVLASCFAVGYVATRWSGPNRQRHTAIIAVASAAGGLVAWRLWARSYYGEWLSMSVLAKRDGDVSLLGSLGRLSGAGVDYVVFVLGRAWILIVLAVIVLGAITWNRLDRAQRILVGSAAFVCSFGAAIAISNKGDWMPFGRLLAPYIPPLILAMAVVVDAGIARSRTPRRWSLPVGVLLIALVLTQPLTWDSGPSAISHPGDDYGQNIAHAYLPGDVIATGPIGRIGYSAPTVPIEDIYGLTEPAVARAPLPANVFGKFDPSYTASLQPTLIVDNAWRDIFEIVDATTVDYVALTGPRLDAVHLFTVVRRDAADRYLAAFQHNFPDTHITQLAAAREHWSTVLSPAGATQAPS